MFECDAPYELVGSTQRQCINGEWTGQQPTAFVSTSTITRVMQLLLYHVAKYTYMHASRYINYNLYLGPFMTATAHPTTYAPIVATCILSGAHDRRSV